MNRPVRQAAGRAPSNYFGVRDVTRLALQSAVAARATLVEQLRREPHDRDDFPATLAAVRDSGLFTVPEIARLVGLSRSRTYELIAQAERKRER